MMLSQLVVVVVVVVVAVAADVVVVAAVAEDIQNVRKKIKINKNRANNVLSRKNNKNEHFWIIFLRENIV